MIQGFGWLLLFQLAGEVLVLGLDWPLPGPVAGMALLFLALLWRGGPGRRLAQTASQLLLHLSLLFVPAGAGVVLYGALLAREWWPLSVALLLSTLLAMAVAALLLRALLRGARRGSKEG
ncbi:MAG: hypothetical protein RLZZ22_645 [Pseudomonadota bacterium]|jgi:holin-like protein